MYIFTYVVLFSLSVWLFSFFLYSFSYRGVACTHNSYAEKSNANWYMLKNNSYRDVTFIGYKTFFSHNICFLSVEINILNHYICGPLLITNQMWTDKSLRKEAEVLTEPNTENSTWSKQESQLAKQVNKNTTDKT